MKTKKRTMKTKARITLFGLVMVIGLCYANFASAESNFATGTGATASASLDFEIVIPSFVYFRVGTAGSGAIDTIYFNPTGADVYGGGATAGTGGDATGGQVNVVLIGNAGDLTIVPSNGGPFTEIGGDTISYDQINTYSGPIAAPDLNDGGGTSPIISAGAFGITNLTDVWRYEYINPGTPPAAGTYSDTVTYTVTVP